MRPNPSPPPQPSFGRRHRAPGQRPAPLAFPEPPLAPTSREASLHAGVMELGQDAYAAFKLSLLVLAGSAGASLLAQIGLRTAIQVLLCGIALAIALFAAAWLLLLLGNRARWRGE